MKESIKVLKRSLRDIDVSIKSIKAITNNDSSIKTHLKDIDDDLLLCRASLSDIKIKYKALTKDEKKILYLTLEKEFFDKILSGEKKEEYRDVKPYWASRLIEKDSTKYIKYDEVYFTNGYGPDMPFMAVEFLGTRLHHSINKYVIKLGEILDTKNISDEGGDETCCRVCGCSDSNPCASGCYWIEPDLCNKCEGKG